MSSSRDRILERLRQHRTDKPSLHTRAMPSIGEQDRTQSIEAFCSRMKAVRAEVRLVAPEQCVEELKRLCRERSFNNLLYSPHTPFGQAINSAWQSKEPPQLISRDQAMEEWKEELFFNIDAAVTATRGGIAETGTLILWPTIHEPRSYSLIPPVHIAVLDSNQLYSTFAEAMEKQQWHEGMPSNALLISGPSKSADIEQTLAYGVHGPTELIVFVTT